MYYFIREWVSSLVSLSAFYSIYLICNAILMLANSTNILLISDFCSIPFLKLLWILSSWQHVLMSGSYEIPSYEIECIGLLLLCQFTCRSHLGNDDWTTADVSLCKVDLLTSEYLHRRLVRVLARSASTRRSLWASAKQCLGTTKSVLPPGAIKHPMSHWHPHRRCQSIYINIIQKTRTA